ncbi:Lipase 3 [Papilio machaon]|uniref:Lipase 3 n=1 Tax=Papilio machaon TaxID=76193 RepID=A0A0N1I738_PAPMA|nr:Lipase 3 [Papilio machaon]
MFRIPKGKRCSGPVRQTPVLLMPGFIVDSDSWLDAGPSSSLAFLLADACYDTWAGNVRGTEYGRRHVRLNPDTDSQFWDFSTHEMGKFDVPAIIEYILNKTRSNAVNYIGYSQGARILYITCSETNACDRVKVFINIAPGVRLKYYRSLPLRLFLKFYALTLPLLKRPEDFEVFPRGGVLQTLGSIICKDNIFAATICKAALFLIDSFEPGSILTETVKALYEHTPAGASAKTIALYAQNMDSFSKYDYGPEKNLEVYGSRVPPEYMLNRTRMPTVLIYGRNDFVADPRDVKWLSLQLPNVAELYEVNRPTWNHVDNTYSQFIKQLLFPKVNEYLLKYSSLRNN